MGDLNLIVVLLLAGGILLYGRAIGKLERRVAELEAKNDGCCKGGPQWGHALDCPKCPD